MFQSASYSENNVYHNKLSLKIESIKFNSFQSIDDVLWRKMKSAHMRHLASPITLENMDDMGCDLLEQKLRDSRNF